MSNTEEKALVKLMLDATRVVLSPLLSEYTNLGTVTYNIGSGVSTYISPKKVRGHKYDFKVNYGEKSLLEKKTRANLPMFITYREEVRAKYFPDPSYQDVMVTVVMHEFAHILQVLEGSRDYRGMHNKAFYTCLNRIYSMGMHVKVREYLDQYAIFRNADFDRTKPYDILGKNELIGVNFVFIRMNKDSEELTVVKILKRNKVSLDIMLVDGKAMRGTYPMVYAKATKKDFEKEMEEKQGNMPESYKKAITQVERVIPNKSAIDNILSQSKTNNQSSMRKMGVKYFIAGSGIPFLVNSLNKKSISATSLKDLLAYNVPYAAIFQKFSDKEALFKYIGSDEVAKLKDPDKEGFTKNNLKGKTYIYFTHQGQSLKGKITRLNAKTVSCLVDEQRKGSIPYQLIEKAE